jgi:hypothetical protein
LLIDIISKKHPENPQNPEICVPPSDATQNWFTICIERAYKPNIQDFRQTSKISRQFIAKLP